jgi:predicted enzyme related to lactoylglutathione lyase
VPETRKNPTLALVILAVRDLAGMKAFYRAFLGWRQVVDAPVYAEYQEQDGTRVGLYADEGFARNIGVAPAPASGITRTELYLHCADLEATQERAMAAGARPLSPLAPRDWGDEVAYLADPEGNVIALARPLGLSTTCGPARG